MSRSVVYSPRARQQLTELYHWITEQSGSPDRAEGFATAIIDYCEELADSPMIGLARDDIRPGLRTIGFRRRAVIAFSADDESVEVHGVYYGGQDFERLIDEERP